MTTPVLALNELGENDPLAYVRINENLRILEALSVGKVVDRDLTAPPGSPVDGAMYLVAASPTGAWANQAAKLTIYVTGAWKFVAVVTGMRIWVVDEAVHLVYNGTSWVAV